MPGHLGLYASRCTWGDPLEGSARELLARAETATDHETKTATESAMDFLRGLLEDGPVPARTVIDDGDQAGHAKRTLQLAAGRLGIERTKEGGHFGGGKQQWVWRLTTRLKMQENSEDARFPRQENTASSGSSCAFSPSEVEL